LPKPYAKSQVPANEEVESEINERSQLHSLKQFRRHHNTREVLEAQIIGAAFDVGESRSGYSDADIRARSRRICAKFVTSTAAKAEQVGRSEVGIVWNFWLEVEVISVTRAS
jgi:hypothetical protein